MGKLLRTVSCILCAIALTDAPEQDGCLQAALANDPRTQELCERAWRATQDEAAAVAGAQQALRQRDVASLGRWAERARASVQGARILHFWAQLQRQRGDLDGAERSYRRALELRIDRDPLRATNSALSILEIVRSSQPAEESIRLARLAWQQAELSKDPLNRALAASALVEMFIELGELGAADAVIRRMSLDDSPFLRDLAQGRLEAARGRVALAATFFERAKRRDPGDPGYSPLDGTLDLVQALLELGRVADARRVVDLAIAAEDSDAMKSIDAACRIDAADALVSQAEGHLDAAAVAVDRGLTKISRDAARVILLNVRGDILAAAGDALAAERAWKEAATSLEEWRASVPTTQLRHALVARHRHALDAWLESAARRGDVDAALEVIQRIVGRSMLDRIRQRESNAPAAMEASIEDVMGRLAIRRELAASHAAGRSLRDAPKDLVAIIDGSQSVWGVRRIDGRWSIDRIGDRRAISRWLDDYRANPDDRAVAERVGAALFPPATVPTIGPLVVLLDPELGDTALAGLRVAGAPLVQRTPIAEILAPELFFESIPERAWAAAVVAGDPTGDLDGARREALAVARALSVEPRIGERATRAVIAGASAARVLHVAAHSSTDSGTASLVLHDGGLSANEIVNAKVAPRLAVIASCRSQVDDDPSASLVAAFLAAGAAGVVGVKRALGDEDGTRLMLDFYRERGAEDPVFGLARAQRAAILAGRPPHAWATVSFFGTGFWLRPPGP